MIFVFISLLLKEIESSCPQPETTFNLHDISKGNYTFNSGEYIYGCHITSQRITSSDCTLYIYACVFNQVRDTGSDGGAIYLSITDNSKTTVSNNRIENCDFNGCYTRSNGGAIYLSSNSFISQFSVIHCKFEKNYGLVNPKGNAIYLDAARGVIQYCTFNCESKSTTTEGSAIYLKFNIDSTPSAFEVNINNNEFIQNVGNSKSYSLIFIENLKKFTLNFNDNSVKIENSENGNFRLCKCTTQLSDYNSKCTFNNIYLTVEGTFGKDSVIMNLPFSTDAIIDHNTVEIPTRPEEPGELPEESSSFEEIPIPDDKDPIYYLDSNNCNLEKRCYRHVKTENQVYVIVLVTNFVDFQQQEENGGAIYIENCGFICNNTEFTGCSSQSGCGGAIFYQNKLELDNNLTFIKNVFTGCKALYGGACYINSESDLSEVYIKSCKFFDNVALSTDSSDDSKFGGICVFMAAKNGNLLGCSFKNSIGLGGSLKVLKGSQNTFSKSLNDNQNLNSILVENCEFVNKEKGSDAIYYICGNDKTKFNVRNCVFKGKLDKNSHYINGLLKDKNSPKILVDSCRFDYDLSRAVNLNLINDEYRYSQNNKMSFTKSQKVEKNFVIFLSGSVLGVAIILILVMITKEKNDYENNKDDSSGI